MNKASNTRIEDTFRKESISVEAEAVSDIVAKLQQGKKAMAERCQRIGKLILNEAGVEKVEYYNRLKGWAISRHKFVRIPEPTTRRRLFILAHEAGHVALNPRHQNAVGFSMTSRIFGEKHVISARRRAAGES